MSPRAIFAIAVSALAWLGSVRADTIILNDGQKVEGTIVEETGDKVVMKIKFGQVSYAKNEIKEIIKSGGAAAAAGEDPSALRDVVIMKSGEEHRGLIVSDDGKTMVFDLITSGKDVSKLMTSQTKFSADEIKDVKKLSDAQRSAARQYIQDVGKQEIYDQSSEQNVTIKSHSWQLKGKNESVAVKKVEMDHFVIESNTEDDFLKRCAFRMGKVFGAYKQHFGVDRNQSDRVRVLIFNSMGEYYASIGNQIKNPAFYHSQMKMVAAGCDYAAYGKQIAEIQTYHKQLDTQLNGLKRELNNARAEVQAKVSKAYEAVNAGGKGASAANQAQLEKIKAQQRVWQVQIGEFEKKVNEVQTEIATLNRRNDMLFSDYTKQMFATLYHESFHAFLDNFLFPEGQSREVPRWLNEGLAQYFEASRMEGSRFILGQEDREKMVILRKFAKESSLLPLEKLVNGGPQDYLVHEISNLENSTKNYLQAWSLVHLLGEKGRLKKEYLQMYVKELVAKKSAYDALPMLTGMPNDQTQKELFEKLKYNFEK